MTAKKTVRKKTTRQSPAPRQSPQQSSRQLVVPSKLTWALAITFTVLSVVFVVQAIFYCYV